jgi:hypothetical protein
MRIKILAPPGSENHRRLAETGIGTVDVSQYNFS